ncbi:hypothetical protein H257_11754 [Aphanomyces astaci]|uniref:Ribosomal protein/NADH dehydrogenase domain-containing protein n=1 Tax=Aphanomyces astaci TaxID=112090 RepID=W4G302_APHAT|nr:hypothetical protein H257_11754 [Aphanomyces astaci]ETV73651.1 hypothetical protein H257_11754 [Aphanomyces astaci]RHY13484.1 hypothetical protein DYB25_004447 [Aphanomyces astaci]RHY22929.1 hypothetical protein DYB36_009821 [Aphanomyces astaci]RHY52674.1 hypothetical protein DYB34_005162 [Aphanomyces astaci]RHY63131.1 hypothetical protein DYB38_005075 [Aphanomyces astaci]|eukprot:XP_009837077.1 hypothetical protein H257_11754 [Aphanomyces astaci]
MAAREIIRFLKKAEISFSSFDSRASGACEFYRQLNAGNTKKVNPKCEVVYTVTVHGKADPLIKLTFINDKQHKFEVPGRDVRDIFNDVEYHCSLIESELEAQGKSMD